MDDAYLKEPGPRAEGVLEDDHNTGVSTPLSPSADAAAAASPGPVTPVLYVSPTSGQLSPGEESRVRLTFTPNRAGVLTFTLPVWLARVPERGTRPYLTLCVKVRRWGGGCFEHLTCREKSLFIVQLQFIVPTARPYLPYRGVTNRGHTGNSSGVQFFRFTTKIAQQ